MNRDQVFPGGCAHVVGTDEPKSVPFDDYTHFSPQRNCFIFPLYNS